MQAKMFGMKYFRLESAKIEGTIKDRPDDFQVTEINLLGKYAELSSAEEHDSTSEPLENRHRTQDTHNSVPLQNSLSSAEHDSNSEPLQNSLSSAEHDSTSEPLEKCHRTQDMQNSVLLQNSLSSAEHDSTSEPLENCHRTQDMQNRVPLQNSLSSAEHESTSEPLQNGLMTQDMQNSVPLQNSLSSAEHDSNSEPLQNSLSSAEPDSTSEPLQNSLMTQEMQNSVPLQNNLSSAEHDSNSEPLQNSLMTQDMQNSVQQNQSMLLEDEDPDSTFILLTRDRKDTSLMCMLGDDTCKKIQLYADRQRNRINKINLATNDESDWVPPLSIGIFHQKNQRADLYAAVKCQFPHLQAYLDDGHEMKISVDDMYLTFRSVLSEDDSNNLLKFVSRREVNETLDLDYMPCKAMRTNMHRLIHKHYGWLLESKTFTKEVDGGPISWIQLRLKERSRGQKRKSSTTKGEISYTGFTLYKENLETLDAIQIIARVLKVHPSDISYAGIKDKRAVTIQFMAVDQPCHRVKRMLNDLVESGGVKVGNFQNRAGPIRTGELWGNDFKIIIRKVRLKEEIYTSRCPSCIESCLKEALVKQIDTLKKDGFVNYFGKQRFGEKSWTPSGSLTADVGLAMLQQDYKRAVDLILSPDCEKEDPINEAKRIFQDSQDARAALTVMPHYQVRECAVLRGLNRHGLEQEGCCKALLGIPHRMRQLYIHSFTSLFWNHMVTQRILEHGYNVVLGDLVATNETGRVTKNEVKHVCAEDLPKYTIKNVVLPLPGNMVEYPKHSIGKAYIQLFTSYGLESCQFRLKSIQLNISGDYRRLIETPLEFQWNLFRKTGNGSQCLEFTQGQSEMIDCADSHESEINTGQHLLSRKSEERTLTQGEAQRFDDGNERRLKTVVKICKCGTEVSKLQTNLNMEIGFKLPSSTYATTLLRELVAD